MKIKSYTLLFRLFSYLSDKTNGAQLFVRYKLMLGTLIIGLAGSTATGKAQNKSKDTIPATQPRPERVTALEGRNNPAEITVKGTVIDQTGEPLPGANILVKNTTRGVIADADGKFTLKAGKKDILVVSFIGFDTQEVAVAYANDRPIVLMESSMILCYEVVVIKTFPDDIYGSSKPKKQKTGKMLYSELHTPPVSPVGNRDAFVRWIEKNIRYTDPMRQAGTEGEVFASFTVDKKGRIKDLKIVDSFSPDAGAEVVRLITSLGNWVPGKHNELPVNTSVTVSVRFAQGEE